MESYGIKLSPPRVIILSYIALITAGTVLFYLLPSTTRELPFIDVLFTVTSAVTVTGLTVADTGKDLTTAGQILILALIQIGGLGYMTLTTFFLVSLRRKIGLRERMVLAQAINYPGLFGLIRFLRRVMTYVFLVEAVGFVLLFLYLLPKYEPETAFFSALFHAISAFNNAGFSLWSQSLAVYREDLFINILFMTLIVLGGTGFFVINELYLFTTGRIRRLSTHTKLVLVVTAVLILGGWIALLLTEVLHYRGIWSLEWGERLISTLFLSVTSRTAGFTTFEISALSESTLFLIMLLMFIGASPGGTGGGIKTTTFTVVILSIASYIRGSSEVVVFRRSIAKDQIQRALVVMSLSVTYIAFINLLIDRIEEKDFLSTLFEVVSAFSTVGLSMGSEPGLSFSSQFSTPSKLLIILTMIVGRVGILSFAIALMGRERKERLRHPEARLLM